MQLYYEESCIHNPMNPLKRQMNPQFGNFSFNGKFCRLDHMMKIAPKKSNNLHIVLYALYFLRQFFYQPCLN